MLRHPTDGSQWRAIDQEFPKFIDDARNLRFALSINGMNPFREQSALGLLLYVSATLTSSMIVHEAEVHCDASAYPRPEATRNDIDVYLRQLVEEILLLWSSTGVRVWDEYKQEHFDLRALLCITITDWPTLSNLSG
jgi:hypothetical protein